MLSAVIMIAFGITSFAATIGQVLPNTEDSTWKRAEDDNEHINYEETNLQYYISELYSGKNVHYNWGVATGNIKFGFKGTKIRIILSNSDISTYGQHSITIDGKTENLYLLGKNQKQIFAYEKTGLSDGIHNVTITFDNKGAFGLDAVDINSDGYLVDFSNPLAPTSLSATAGNSKIKLSWIETTTIGSSIYYNVKRSETEGGPYSIIATTSSITYTDDSVTNGKTYYYVVSAVVDGIESSESNEASATPQASTDPNQPTGNKALLVIALVTGERKEYEMTTDKINDFIAWYNSKAASGPTYVIEKDYNKASFTARKDYIVYEQISNFEVNEYNQ